MVKRALIFCGILALAGCGSKEESTTIAGTTYSSNEQTGTAKIEHEGGSIEAVDGDAAAKMTLPNFAPNYPGSTISAAIKTQRDGKTNQMVTLITGDPLGKVAAYYKEAFAKGGLKIASEMSTAEAVLMSAEGNGKKVSFTGGLDEDGKTSIVLSFSGE